MLLFIHGLDSSSGCWANMLELLRGDERIMSGYEHRCWDYPTKLVEMGRQRRIATLEELGKSLGEEIDSPAYRGRELTLVGHSLGGLVILGYFHELLSSGRASELRNVRQAICFASPFLGSTKATLIRRLLSPVLKNPLETALRVLNPEVARMLSAIREKIVAATADTDDTWRVPIHAFWGEQDDVVLEASARGVFESAKGIPGDHSSILKPADRDRDHRYTEFVELLLDPGGHSHRFEIEHYETRLRVEPRERQTIETRSYRNPRKVEFDNYARLKRTVRFAPINRCRSPFTIQYGTQGKGYVVGHTNTRNEADSSIIGEWEDHGLKYRFDFKPRSEEEYWLDVEIYDGFCEARREVHFHLDDNSRRRRMTYLLDLSGYVAGGWAVPQEPRLYLDPKNLAHDELCQQRAAGPPVVLASQTPEGVYRWELEDVREGIIDIVWNVQQGGQ